MSAHALPFAKFRLGRIVTTPNALQFLTHHDILRGIQRHQAGDWGDVGENDRLANERALIEHTRLWSVYRANNGLKFWIITGGDRTASTILMPEDY
jgi:hypothetical protein